MSDRARPDDLPVAPELARLRGLRLLCVYGSDEKDSGCRNADPSLGMERIERGGAHHFDKNYPALGGLVLTLMSSCPAISRFVMPCATRRRISF